MLIAQNDLDYIDDNAERLARRKMKSDAMKRAFAIKDFARTKRALDTCPFCYQDDRQPLTAIVALGTRTYLCCTLTEELVPGHCLIVPIQHCLSSLEMEDDDWEEVRVSPASPNTQHQTEPTAGLTTSSELHEVPNADVCQGEQGRAVLRDQPQLPTTATHVYRSGPRAGRTVRRLPGVFPGESAAASGFGAESESPSAVPLPFRCQTALNTSCGVAVWIIADAI
jgi:hypothetical protein